MEAFAVQPSAGPARGRSQLLLRLNRAIADSSERAAYRRSRHKMRCRRRTRAPLTTLTLLSKTLESRSGTTHFKGTLALRSEATTRPCRVSLGIRPTHVRSARTTSVPFRRVTCRVAWDEDGSLEAGADVGRGHLVAGLLMGPGDLVGPAAVEHVVDDAGAPAMAVCKRMHECLRAARREESAYSSFFWTATKTHLFSAPGRLF